MNILASILSFFTGEDGISRLFSIMYSVFLVCVLVGFWLYHRSSEAELRELRADNTALHVDLGQAASANAAQQTVIEALKKQRIANNAKIEQAAREIAGKDKNVRSLSNQLRKAMHENDQFRAGLGRAVTNALCLQYLAYEGRLPGDYLGADPATAFDGRADSVAAFCRSWREATPEDVTIWTGELMRQVAGFNARAKAAKGNRAMGNNE